MRCLVVAGGAVDTALLRKEVEKAEVIIAADHGLDALQQIGARPRIILGDFDSLSKEGKATLKEYEDSEDVEVLPLPAEKDVTDTEYAVSLAMEYTVEGDPVIVLGATGTRLDHVLGNIAILGLGIEHERDVFLLDPHNRIRMSNKDVVISMEEQYGKYVSLFPFGSMAAKVTLEGFKYPVQENYVGGYHSLGVSNEITGDRGVITIHEGTLIIIESID